MENVVFKTPNLQEHHGQKGVNQPDNVVLKKIIATSLAACLSSAFLLD